MFVRSRQLLKIAYGRVEETHLFDPVRAWMVALSERERMVVERTWMSARRGIPKLVCGFVSRVGNGGLYVVLFTALLLLIEDSTTVVLCSTLAILIAHLIYPWVKHIFGRDRPFHRWEHLVPDFLPLDRHSFPSGHSMTLTAAALPLMMVYPGSIPAFLVAWGVMAWARIACAHHYPSDIAAGTVLGLAAGSVSMSLFLA